MRDRRRSLASNVVSNVAARVVLGVIGLVTIPVVIHRLGPEAFGVYAVSISLTGLVGIFDLGLTTAFINQLAAARRNPGVEDVEGLVGTAISVFAVLGAVLWLATTFAAPVIVTRGLRVSPGLVASATMAIDVTAVGVALNLWLSVLDAIPIAYERYDIVAARISAISLLAALVSLAYALVGGGLVGLAVINSAGAAIGLITFYRVARRLLPGVRLVPRISVDSLRALTAFSIFKFAGTASAVAVFRFDQIAIGFLLGARAAGFYGVPSGLLSRLLALVASAASPVFPRVSVMAPGDPTLSRLYLDATRWIAVIALPLAFVFAAAPGAIVAVWIGGPDGHLVAVQAAPTMRWLMLAFAIQSMAAAPAIFCEATGRPWINNLFAVASLAIHIPMFLVLVPLFGLEGAGITLFMNSLIQTVPFIVVATRRVAGLSAMSLVRTSLARPIVASTIPVAITLYLAHLASSRASMAATLLLAGFAYVLAAYFLGAISRADLARGRQIVSGAAGR